MLSPYALGATLYMPATRPDLWSVVSGQKIPNLKSVVICLEDAVSEMDVSLALQHVQQLLHRLVQEERATHAPLLFIRPRHVRMAAQLSEWSLIHQIDGMVLPKFDLHTARQWQDAVARHLLLMPTLETQMVYDSVAMRELRMYLQEQALPILALRIGGNDLLACLGLRRPRLQTIYQTPVGALIAQLVGLFRPYGFALTAPVCEYFQDDQLLQAELQQDLQNGLVGKTVIHPSQIALVHEAFQVSMSDFAAAQQILSPHAQAVFQHEGAMLEPATHLAWAQQIGERAKYFGVSNQKSVLKIL